MTEKDSGAWRKRLAEKYGDGYVLRQLAEEACELGQAALKLVRARRGETPVQAPEAEERLIEEMADVLVMAEIALVCLREGAEESIAAVAAGKCRRMRKRMLNE